jgi:hypothetical protein
MLLCKMASNPPAAPAAHAVVQYGTAGGCCLVYYRTAWCLATPAAAGCRHACLNDLLTSHDDGRAR